ncbi:MAG: hypothetical protein J7540_07320 [Roseofilum sp. SID2]|uniref:hypothetical protein n=1 Tax=unclassified Roseofilum TaxID=2620099 RepID=UPI001B21F230|nr:MULTISPECIES: hypothetical protein [unclassified Roseofilum]MBP0015918.1 hypothetical protein [Roseofilum sp. SID3]MBP0023789.1 hypothetical protein [Roseofilum sp. SID2]MBP0038932.1 hypothetical protein [Roseofilum sp. SID1]
MQALLLSIFANMISAMILGLAGFIAYGYLYLKNRKEVLNFFGVTSTNPRICIYVSNLNIKSGGTSGIELIEKGYSGSAITKLEYEGALLLQGELKAKPLVLLAKEIQNWLGSKILELRTIDAPIEVSPTKDPIFKQNLIILGTGIYNSLSHYYLRNYFPRHSNDYDFYFYHTKDNEGRRVIGIRQKGLKDTHIDEGREINAEPGFIQRFRDIDRDINIFICAGLGSSATFGTARYLAENWRDLQQQFGDHDFGIGLLFHNQNPDDESVKHPEIRLRERLKRPQ